MTSYYRVKISLFLLKNRDVKGIQYIIRNKDESALCRNIFFSLSTAYLHNVKQKD